MIRKINQIEKLSKEIASILKRERPHIEVRITSSRLIISEKVYSNPNLSSEN